MNEMNVHPLKQIRRELNISQEDLATATLLSIATIKRAEKGEPLNDDVISQICTFISEQYHGEMDAGQLGLRRRRRSRVRLGNDNSNKVSAEKKDQLDAALTQPSKMGARAEVDKDPDLEGEDAMEKLRRDILQLLQRLGLVATIGVVPARGQQDLITEVQRVLHQPLGLGDKELKYMEQKIRDYWRARQSVTIAPTDLLLDVVAYVQEVTAFLDRSLLPSTRMRLCACLSQGMLLIGVISYDAGQFQKARKYYQTAIDAAHEAEQNILQALAWVWDSYSWMRCHEEGRYEQAQVSVNKACHFASLGSDLAVRCNALEASAEVYAYLKEKDTCIEALDNLAKLAECEHGDWWHIHQFDRSKLNGVRGVCLQQFYRPGVPDTDPLLEEARQALNEALSQPNVLALRRAFHVVDLAQVHAREGEVEAACDYAEQVITIASTKAPIRQRLWTVRTILEPYATVAAVRNLDRDITELLLGR